MSTKKSKFSIHLAEIRVGLGFANDKEMAVAFGLKPNTLNSYMNSEEMPISINLNLLSNLSNRGVDLHWLLTGANGGAQGATGRSNDSGGYGDGGQAIDALAARITALNDKIRILENQTVPIDADQAVDALVASVRDEDKDMVLGAIEALLDGVRQAAANDSEPSEQPGLPQEDNDQ